MSRSEYYLTLSSDVKIRYDEKIKINNIDPYTLSVNELFVDLNFVAEITVMDMVNYLILTHSFYTGNQMKAYKSLQAYKFYEAGFVQEVRGKKINENCSLVIGKVRHSQKAQEKPLDTWVVVLADGSISSGHCTCMAGLGEVCSHVAAVLFYLNSRPTGGEVPTGSEIACTEKLARWPVPSTKSVDMVRLRDMDWNKKGTASGSLKSQLKVPELSNDELAKMLRNIQATGISPGLVRVCEPFASEMVKDFMPVLQSLADIYDESLANVIYEDLLKIPVDICITKQECEDVEKTTRDQAESNAWFKYRAGRITASKFKSVTRAKIAKPPLSLIKGVCYPQKVIFYSKQTNYGLKKEKKALNAYTNQAKSQHNNLSVKKVGFSISEEHPELGASPDGLVDCECCGMGCVEIKCPFLLLNMPFADYVEKKTTCLVKSDEGSYLLDQSHSYYFQVQLQMFVTKLKYCDFVVWSEKDLHVNRIQYDESFCKENILKALDFHKFVIKPELLARYFTRQAGAGQVETWCICGKPDDGKPMLQCDNDDCNIKWFHFECVNILETPDTLWFCSVCSS